MISFFILIVLIIITMIDEVSRRDLGPKSIHEAGRIIRHSHISYAILYGAILFAFFVSGFIESYGDVISSIDELIVWLLFGFATSVGFGLLQGFRYPDSCRYVVRSVDAMEQELENLSSSPSNLRNKLSLLITMYEQHEETYDRDEYLLLKERLLKRDDIVGTIFKEELERFKIT